MNVKGEAIEGAVALRSKGVILSSPGEILLGSEEIKLHMTGGVHRMLSGHAWGGGMLEEWSQEHCVCPL